MRYYFNRERSLQFLLHYLFPIFEPLFPKLRFIHAFRFPPRGVFLYAHNYIIDAKHRFIPFYIDYERYNPANTLTCIYKPVDNFPIIDILFMKYILVMYLHITHKR